VRIPARVRKRVPVKSVLLVEYIFFNRNLQSLPENPDLVHFNI